MKLICVTDKPGRIQHSRMILLSGLIRSVDLHVQTSDKVSFKQADAVYYAHFSLMEKCPCKRDIPKLASVTSHKCLSEFKKTVKTLKKFHRVSVNNRILLNTFKDHVPDIFYTPNGVDTNFFSFCDKEISSNPMFGWVGNTDRDTKNFKSIVSNLPSDVSLSIVGSSKKDKKDTLMTKLEMKEYYSGLDFFLVTSSTEGTPNPGLEALSTGIPVISTKVGNMVDLIDETNGRLIEDNLSAFVSTIRNMQEINPERYIDMRKRARSSVESWDWSRQYKRWETFLTL